MAIKVNGNTVIGNTMEATVSKVAVTSAAPEVLLVESDIAVGAGRYSRVTSNNGVMFIQSELGDIRFTRYGGTSLNQPPKIFINSTWEPILYGNSNITIGSSRTLDVSGGSLTLANNQVPGAAVAYATTTLRGSVEKATIAEAQAGTAGAKYPDVIGVKAAIAAQTSRHFKSIWHNNLPAAGSTTITGHNLGIAPDRLELLAECTTADGMFVVGERLPIPVGVGGNNPRITITATASNIKMLRGTGPLYYNNGYSYPSLTDTSWKWQLIAKVIR